MATLFTGCGDDDNDNNNNNNNPGTQNFGPTTAAELQSSTKTYTVSADGGTTTIKFPAPQQYTAQAQDGTIENGNTSEPAHSGNTWSFTATPDAGQTNTHVQNIELTFTSANAGTFRSTETDTGTVHTGNFTVADTGGNTDGGTNGNTDGNTDGTTNGGTTGAHPTTLSGKSLQLQTTGAGQELFTMSSATDFSSDIQATGTYTYTLTGDTAHFTTDYNSPAQYANDFYDLTLTFTSDNAGTFTGNQHFGDTDHDTSGNFTITNPQ
jgi:hypothetical protein